MSVGGIGCGRAIDPDPWLISGIGVGAGNGAALNLAIARAHAVDSIRFSAVRLG
jgi:hypothetical protein